jgi:hypothetical protein
VLKNVDRAGGVPQMVEHLPSKPEAPSSNCSITKKKKVLQMPIDHGFKSKDGKSVRREK